MTRERIEEILFQWLRHHPDDCYCAVICKGRSFGERGMVCYDIARSVEQPDAKEHWDLISKYLMAKEFR